MIYDASRRSIVLFGGSGLDDTWEWDGNEWSKSIPLVRPPSRQNFGLAYEPARRRGILFGGQLVNDLWQFRYDGPAAETCIYGFDADGDGLLGCADPDCWGYCAPLCPPGAACSPTAPTCGDGNCSAIESCRFCPGDCGACTPVCGDFLCDSGETIAACPGDCS